MTPLICMGIKNALKIGRYRPVVKLVGIKVGIFFKPPNIRDPATDILTMLQQHRIKRYDQEQPEINTPNHAGGLQGWDISDQQGVCLPVHRW